MALRGSLAEINMLDLVRLLRASRGTGELVVAGLEDDARLLFVDGKLVSAASRQVEGREAVEGVLRWRDGEFEFRHQVEPPRPSADTGLDAVLVELEETHRGASSGGNGSASQPSNVAPDQLADPRVQQLAWFVESQPLIEHACLIDREGGIRGQSSTNLVPLDEIRKLAEALACYVGKYPRSDLRRMIIEDGRGIVVLSRLSDSSALVLVADARAAVGAVSAAATRLVARLEGCT